MKHPQRGWPIVLLLTAMGAGLPLRGGPVEFGMAEVQAAVEARGLTARQVRFTTAVGAGAPESYEILPGRITGGDLRGLMYGLLEAAAQIRSRGRLVAARGSAATPVRGIRYFLHNRDLESRWYSDREYWDRYFAMLARNRFNRFNLVFAHQTNYLAPPYPFWLELPEFPEVRVPGLAPEQRRRNLEMLQYITRAAADHGIEFTLGIWEHNVQTGMQPSVDGLTGGNIGPYSRAALQQILRLCPDIRSVQVRTNRESGIPDDQQVEFYRDYVFPAIRDAGRLVYLDLRGWAVAQGMIDAAKSVGAPLRLSTKYWAEDLGRPYQPAETYPGYSYLNFLEKPRSYDFYWELWGLGSHRLLLWGNADYVRRAAPTFRLGGSMGFEIDPPLAQKGFGNRPGEWGVFTESENRRVFWKYEFERYWMFYLLWGRLSYDPRTPEAVWMDELRRRFGAAAPDVWEAYQQSSRVLHEIVAVHLADPNMYIWPEINPGGLIDAYRDVLPSDWRFVASVREAVRDRLEGRRSAKQKPAETAARLNEFAARTEQAAARAGARLAADHREWQSSEPDFLVLAALARYHAFKQTAAYELTRFDESGDLAALDAARGDLRAALGVWEKLARLTDGLYPAEMAFGPDDVGHWKDKLPYVRHDLELIEERARVHEQVGPFELAFDFGAPVERAGNPAAYRRAPYVLRNNVAPRFRPVEPGTRYEESRGYGWAAEGARAALGMPLAPYHEVRAVARRPQRLPRNTLFGDFIVGKGAQEFHIRSGPGDFQVLLLHPDGTSTSVQLRAEGDLLKVAFPDGDWSCSGVVVKGARAKAAPPAGSVSKPLPRPRFFHVPPKTAPAGRPLALRLGMAPAGNVAAVRLHYRAVNQLARFKTIEQAPPRLAFLIPAEDIPPNRDLMYYFEILAKDDGGWFEPDPQAVTPYHVVEVTPAGAAAAQ